MLQGTIFSVNGPIVKAHGLSGSAMLELVEVGALGLIGEIIRCEDDLTTIQVYEENSGLKPGEPVVSRGMPVSIALGPGLIGSIYFAVKANNGEYVVIPVLTDLMRKQGWL